jgi:WD40 repeat protein
MYIAACWLVFTMLSLPTLADDSHAKGETHDFYGDPLPPHCVARLGSIRFRPMSDTWTMDLSPEGKLVATGTMPGSLEDQVELWDTETGKKTGAMLTGTNNIICAVFSPDGKRLAVAHDHRVEILDVAARRVVRELDTTKAGAMNDRSFWWLSWSPDGKHLAATVPGKKAAWLWAATGEHLHTFRLPGTNSFTGGFMCLAFSPDSKSVAIGGDEFLHIYDVATLKAKHTRELPKQCVNAVAFSPDFKHLGLAIGPTYELKLREVKNGEGFLVDPPSEKELEPVRVELWNADATRLKQLAKWKKSSVQRLVFTPDGKTLLATGFSGPVVAWDIESAKLRYEISGDGRVGRSVAISGDGRVLVTAGRRIGLWNATTGAPLFPSPSHSNSVFSLALLRDGKTVISNDAAQSLRVWEVATGRPLESHRTFAGWGAALAVSPDDKLIAVAGNEAEVRFFQRDFTNHASIQKPKTSTPESRNEEDVLRAFKSPVVSSLAFLSNNMLVSTSMDGSVDLWDVANRKHLAQVLKVGVSLTSLAVSPDGKLIGVPAGSAIEVWDVAERRQVGSVPAMRSIFAVPAAFSPEGKRLVTAVPNPNADPEKPLEKRAFLRLWDWKMGDPVWTSDNAYSEVQELAYSPDGKLIASTHTLDNHRIRLWSAADGHEVLVLEGHVDVPRHLLFTPDGKRLLSASQDTTVLVWDTRAALSRITKSP